MTRGLLRLLPVLLLLVPQHWVAAEELSYTITARTMVVQNLKKEVVFRGDVRLKGRVFSLTADQLVLFLSSAPMVMGGSGPHVRASGIVSMEAAGHVTILQEDREARADRASYVRKEERVVLTGHPEVQKGRDIVRGSRVILLLEEDRTIVEQSEMVLGGQ